MRRMTKDWGACLLVALLAMSANAQDSSRWSAEQANAWYAQQPWLVGANYVPSDAINQLEMFQAATWNPRLNDKELGMAEGIGMNTMRVFLQDQLWSQDPAGFTSRLNEFLSLASKHHIRPIPVLFDSCWDPQPHLGPQLPPIPGVHNSGWVQSPGSAGLERPRVRSQAEGLCAGRRGRLCEGPRVLAWDIWNEPDGMNTGPFGDLEPADKRQRVDSLLPKAFAWAREEKPIQPLTSGVFLGNWSDPDKESATTKIQLAESDVISFHNYGWPEEFEAPHQGISAVSDVRSSAPSTWPAAPAARSTTLFPSPSVSRCRDQLGARRRQDADVLSLGFVAEALHAAQPTIWFHEVFRQSASLTGSVKWTS